MCFSYLSSYKCYHHLLNLEGEFLHETSLFFLFLLIAVILGSHFGVDLMHRKAEVKDIITDAINEMSDDDEGEENTEDENEKEKEDKDRKG